MHVDVIAFSSGGGGINAGVPAYLLNQDVVFCFHERQKLSDGVFSQPLLQVYQGVFVGFVYGGIALVNKKLCRPTDFLVLLEMLWADTFAGCTIREYPRDLLQSIL